MLRVRMYLLLALFVPLPVLAQGAEGTLNASSLPDAYVLSAAHPNPFNPETNFTLEVQERQHVRVEVFNLLGQPVRRLYDGMIEPGVPQRFRFDAGDLPSGIYIYRAVGDRFTASRQMTLLR